MAPTNAPSSAPSAVAGDDSCRYHNDGMCDEPNYCSVGTDCTDCNNCGPPKPEPPRLFDDETAIVATSAVSSPCGGGYRVGVAGGSPSKQKAQVRVHGIRNGAKYSNE